VTADRGVGAHPESASSPARLVLELLVALPSTAPGADPRSRPGRRLDERWRPRTGLTEDSYTTMLHKLRIGASLEGNTLRRAAPSLAYGGVAGLVRLDVGRRRANHTFLLVVIGTCRQPVYQRTPGATTDALPAAEARERHSRARGVDHGRDPRRIWVRRLTMTTLLCKSGR
jgi:hypothetical protein